MDQIENELRDYYQKKRRSDAASTPDFDSMWNKLESQKSTQRGYPLLRIAAAVAAVLIAVTGYLYFNGTQTASSDRQLSALDPHIPPPLKVLEDKTFAPEYIWTWKAPTDQLLLDANQSLKKIQNGKF